MVEGSLVTVQCHHHQGGKIKRRKTHSHPTMETQSDQEINLFSDMKITGLLVTQHSLAHPDGYRGMY